MATALNAHTKPPASIREVYKEYQKLSNQSLSERDDLIQFSGSSQAVEKLLYSAKPFSLPEELQHILNTFVVNQSSLCHFDNIWSEQKREVYEIAGLPGLLFYPNLFPPSTQTALLDKLLHRDVANPEHQTNLHLHYHVPYPDGEASYFSATAGALTLQPKDPRVHKPLNIAQFLNRKLRWTTLGGQYDWTNKVYPSSPPPPFPPDIKQLIDCTFPMKAEAAIVNLYTPGDTLSLHRDVSEDCDRPLVSISLGCDAVFVCGLEAEADRSEPRIAVMRLRSGDAVLMSGESRYAWHGVPKVLQETCPQWLACWPASGKREGDFERWRGWMKDKRVNLNVRQMFE